MWAYLWFNVPCACSAFCLKRKLCAPIRGPFRSMHAETFTYGHCILRSDFFSFSCQLILIDEFNFGGLEVLHNLSFRFTVFRFRKMTTCTKTNISTAFNIFNISFVQWFIRYSTVKKFIKNVFLFLDCVSILFFHINKFHWIKNENLKLNPKFVGIYIQLTFYKCPLWPVTKCY